MTLSHEQVRRFYDRFGARQDSQAFYERAAQDELIAHAGFEQAGAVFEFGCGTGRFARTLLEGVLPATARYTGMDLSRTMVGLAGQALAAFGDRARVILSDGAIRFPLADQSVDHVVSSYVFDLLSEADIRLAFSEAARVLKPGGRVCLLSLTRGVGPVSRMVTSLWRLLYRLHAPLVGGCRPIVLEDHMNRDIWSLEYHRVVVRYGIPSEVLVAGRRPGP